MVQLLQKSVWQLLKKTYIELPHDPAIPLLGINPKVLKTGTWTYTSVYSSIIHNSQKVETTQMSINRWMDKQNVLYTYNAILFSLKKRGNSGICYNMNETWRHYVKWNKLDTKGQILYDSTYMRCLEQSNSETENRMMVARIWGNGKMVSYFLMGTEFHFVEMKNLWRWIVMMVVQQCEYT